MDILSCPVQVVTIVGCCDPAWKCTYAEMPGGHSEGAAEAAAALPQYHAVRTNNTSNKSHHVLGYLG